MSHYYCFLVVVCSGLRPLSAARVNSLLPYPTRSMAQTTVGFQKMMYECVDRFQKSDAAHSNYEIEGLLGGPPKRCITGCGAERKFVVFHCEGCNCYQCSKCVEFYNKNMAKNTCRRCEHYMTEYSGAFGGIFGRRYRRPLPLNCQPVRLTHDLFENVFG